MRKTLTVLAVVAGAAALLTAPAAAASHTWEDCPFEGPAACATVTVPVNYRNPDGQRIDIHVSRLRSTRPDLRRGTLVMNQGGPGPHLSDAASAHERLPKAVLDAYDIVSFDQRGFGASAPVRCGLSPEEQFTFAWPLPGGEPAMRDRARSIAGKCAGQELMPFLGTANVARDMDRIRAALGEQRITYLEVAGVCAVWTLLAAAAVAVGAYLRWLDGERARSVAAARREQRVRLARDLHDWLAHEMTGIVLAAQAGQLDESDAVRTLGQIEEAGTRGLAAMDRALRLLRSATDERDHAVTIAEVNEVVARFAETSAATVTSEIDDLGTPRPEIVATVHRVVVESLTNVRRHAPNAAEVLVRVTHTGTDVVVEVSNDGGGRPPKRGRRGGTGLTGLAEWVGALDGTLTAGPAPCHGWTVRAVVPA